MLFRQSAKHDSYYISCEKNLENGYYATLSTSMLGGGVSPPPLNVCLRWKQGRESDAVGCCSLWSSGNIWQCEIANQLPGIRNEQRLPLSFYHDDYK